MPRAGSLATVCLVALVALAGCPSPDGGGYGSGSPSSAPATGDQGSQPTEEGEPAAEDGTSSDQGNATEEENATMDPADQELSLASPAFQDGRPIPPRHACPEPEPSPELQVQGVPPNATSLAIIVDDPDAPTNEPWVHWLIWNLPADASTIPEGYPPSGDASGFDAAVQGQNSFPSDNLRYRGPCPPKDDGAHTYRFQLFALDQALELDRGASRGQLEAAMDGHILEVTVLTGTYDR